MNGFQQHNGMLKCSVWKTNNFLNDPSRLDNYLKRIIVTLFILQKLFRRLFFLGMSIMKTTFQNDT